MSEWEWALWGSVAVVALDAWRRARRALAEARGLGLAHHRLTNALHARFHRERLRRKWFQAELRDYLVKLREFLRWGPMPPPDFDAGPHESDDSDPGKATE